MRNVHKMHDFSKFSISTNRYKDEIDIGPLMLTSLYQIYSSFPFFNCVVESGVEHHKPNQQSPNPNPS